MASFSCIDFLLEAGAFAADSGHVTVPSIDVPFPVSLFTAGSAAGGSVASAPLTATFAGAGSALGLSVATGVLSLA